MTKPTTHIALPVNVARAARMLLGKMPHDELSELLTTWDAEARGVNIEPKEGTDGQPS